MLAPSNRETAMTMFRCFGDSGMKPAELIDDEGMASRAAETYVCNADEGDLPDDVLVDVVDERGQATLWCVTIRKTSTYTATRRKP